MRRPVLAALAWLATALPAAALCTGTSLLDRLTPDDMARFDAAVAGIPHAEGLIFRASRGAAQIVLIGTMHIHDPRLDAIEAAVAPHLAEADLLLLEMTPAEEGALMGYMAANPDFAFITEGDTLPVLLGEDWDAVAAAARDRQIPGFVAAKSRPWYLMLSLSIPPCAMGDLIEQRRGLDHRLMTLAERRGLPMQALEPFDTLFGLFTDMPMEQQLDYLRMSVLDPELTEEMFVATLDLYFAGEIARTWELSRIALRFSPELDLAEMEQVMDQFETRLLAERNQAWIPVIEAAAARHDDIVVAAGAAHLPGDQGVLQLLEQRGWRVERLD